MENKPPSLLTSLAQEKKQPQAREIEVHTSKSIARALEEFKYALANYILPTRDGVGELSGYRTAQERLDGIKFSQNELQEFLFAIKDFEEERNFVCCGMFISALINAMPILDVDINLSHLDSSIHFIGMCNTKNLTINGNVGCGSGRGMLGGRITINGTASFTDPALLESGKIIVRDGHETTDRKTGARTIHPTFDKSKEAYNRMQKAARIASAKTAHPHKPATAQAHPTRKNRI